MIRLITIILSFLLIHSVFIENGIIPHATKWLIELSSMAIMPVILIVFSIKKRFFANPIYIFLLIALFGVILLGVFINHSSASALILGIRYHFKFLPYFLLPLVYYFSDAAIKKILILLCITCYIQLPVTFYQRFVQYRGVITGDFVTGTVGGSGVLSITLISAISILYALYLKKIISLHKLILLSLFMFLPTMINETKITFFLTPISLIVSTILLGDKNLLLIFKRIATFFTLAVIFATLFTLAYNAIYGSKGERSFFDYLVQEKEGRGYIYHGEENSHERIKLGQNIGRADSIMMAINNISDDVGKLFFGVGIGNAVTTRISFLAINNDDVMQYSPDMTTISYIFWELGILGMMINLAFLFFIFKDSLRLRHQEGIIGAIGLGWCSNVSIIFITMFYLNLYYVDPLNLTFWFLSGVIVSRSSQIQRKEFLNESSDIDPTASHTITPLRT